MNYYYYPEEADYDVLTIYSALSSLTVSGRDGKLITGS
jgi:hypothetical protein